MGTEAHSAVVFCASKASLKCLLFSRLTSPGSSLLSLQALEMECPKAYTGPWPRADGKDCFSFLLPLCPAQDDAVLSSHHADDDVDSHAACGLV